MACNYERIEPFFYKHGAGKIFNHLAIIFPAQIIEEEKLIDGFSRNDQEQVMELILGLINTEGSKVVMDHLNLLNQAQSDESEIPVTSLDVSEDATPRFDTPASENASTPVISKKVRFALCRNCPVLRAEKATLTKEIERNWALIEAQHREIEKLEKSWTKGRNAAQEIDVKLKSIEDRLERANKAICDQKTETVRRDELLADRAREIGRFQAQIFEQNCEINDLRAKMATFEQRKHEQVSSRYEPMSTPEAQLFFPSPEPVYQNRIYEEIEHPSDRSPDIFERPSTPFPNRSNLPSHYSFNQSLDATMAGSNTFGTLSMFTGDGKITFSTWLKEFLNVARCVNWNTEQQLIQMSIRFKGSALDYFDQFTKPQKIDYYFIISEMKSRFDTPESTLAYEAELAVLKRKPDEMPQVFANKLKEVFSKANPIQAKNEMERACFRKVHEKQIIKLFIQKINNRRIEERLHFDDPLTLNEAIEISMKQFQVNKLMFDRPFVNAVAEVQQEKTGDSSPFKNPRNSSNRNNNVTCSLCGKAGHSVDECFSNRKCEGCGRPGHTRNYCYHTKPCRYCSQTGHSPFYCPRRSEITCPYCKEKGHYQLECPKFKAEKCKPICDFCGEMGHQNENCSKRDEAKRSENSNFSTKAGPSSANM